VGTLTISTTSDVLLLYPGASLTGQVRAWAERHPGRQVAVSFERSLPEIRKLLARAHSAMVDGTEDGSLATDAFLQAVARLGAGAVTMYTEKMHDGLELFVRVRGSPFLLGPMLDGEWDALFERSLRAELPAAQLPDRLVA
jgi:hypothetical protein